MGDQPAAEMSISINSQQNGKRPNNINVDNDRYHKSLKMIFYSS